MRKVLRAGFPFFNLYKLAVIAGGKKLIADVEHRPPGQAMAAQSMVYVFFRFGLRHSLDKTAFGLNIRSGRNRPNEGPFVTIARIPPRITLGRLLVGGGEDVRR